MRTVPDLKELFKQASEIAQQVPANMQEAAFNRALDLLTSNVERVGPGTSPALPRGVPKRQPAPQLDAGATETLLNQIDSTQHPGVTSATKILDRALMVLKIALDEHDIDGLAPSAIAKVLTDKFRVSTEGGAVSMALGRATTLVNRVPGSGGGFIYRIMAPGNEYLVSLASPGAAKDARRSRAYRPPNRGRANGKGQPTEAKVVAPTAAQPVKQPRAARRSSGTPGPKAAVMSLIGAGFFNAGKTGQDVQAHLKTKRGFSFEPDQLRVALLRLVRDQALDREPNSDGDYEYKRK